MNIATLLPWGPAKEVMTGRGPRLLRVADPDETFWDLWRSRKAELQAAGVACGKKGRTMEWQICWWTELPKAVVAERQANADASRAASSDFDPPCPLGLAYYPFQRAGIAYAKDKEGCLIADEAGLGKTCQSIALINLDESIEYVLVVTRATLKLNWKREIERWLTRDFQILITTGQYFPRATIKNTIIIANYDNLLKWKVRLDAIEWDMVILDEAQAIKNRSAQRTKALIGYYPSLKKQEAGEKVIERVKARRRVALSGTPMEQRPEELWAILNFLDPKRWGSFYGYAKRFCGATSNGYGMETSGASNLPELQKILRETCMVRRLKKDVLKELPPKTRMIVELDSDQDTSNDEATWNKHQGTLEKAQVDLELARASEDNEAFKEAVKRIGQCTQIAFDEIARVRHDSAVSKLPAAIAMLQEEMDEFGVKILVFFHHRDVGQELKRWFPMGVLVTGETSLPDRDEAVSRFQNESNTGPFFGSIRACGEGLTLTAAHLVIFIEEDWVPSKTSQCEDRAHRIGQKDNVLVKHYVVRNTIDAKMLPAQLEKQKVIDAALDDEHAEIVYEPVLLPKHEPIGKRREIAEQALLITTVQNKAIHNGLKRLAWMCDGANKLDGHGFSKIDAGVGHSLAAQSSLTPRQAALGRMLCRKYKRQLGDLPGLE